MPDRGTGPRRLNSEKSTLSRNSSIPSLPAADLNVDTFKVSSVPLHCPLLSILGLSNCNMTLSF